MTIVGSTVHIYDDRQIYLYSLNVCALVDPNAFLSISAELLYRENSTVDTIGKCAHVSSAIYSLPTSAYFERVMPLTARQNKKPLPCVHLLTLWCWSYSEVHMLWWSHILYSLWCKGGPKTISTTRINSREAAYATWALNNPNLSRISFHKLKSVMTYLARCYKLTIIRVNDICGAVMNITTENKF